jgi:mannose-1-phosphate guanylyltransferase
VKAIILAAGLGTRLKPLTDFYAKPSLPVAGTPALWYAAYSLYKSLQINEFVLNTHHLSNSIVTACENNKLKEKLNFNFSFSDESQKLLGSLGGVIKCVEHLNQDEILVTNGDSISNIDWKSFLNHHKNSGAEITMHLRTFREKEKYSIIKFDETTKLIQEIQSPESHGVMFSGNYILNRKTIKNLKIDVLDFKKDLVLDLIKNQKAFAYYENCEWYDIGSPENYLTTNLEIIKNPFFKEIFNLNKAYEKSLKRNVLVSGEFTEKLSHDQKEHVLKLKNSVIHLDKRVQYDFKKNGIYLNKVFCELNIAQ